MKRIRHEDEDTYEGQRLERIRKQMRERSKNRFRDPDYDPSRIPIQLVFVWRENAWIPITWFRADKVSLRKIRKLREKYLRKRSKATRGKIGRKETVRVLPLIAARLQGGAGLPPREVVLQAKLKSRKGDRGVHLKNDPHRRFTSRSKTTAKTTTKTIPRRRKSQAPGRLSRCDFVFRKQRCSFRGFWFVAYMDDKKPIGKKHTVKCRCSKHAWKDEYFPETARNIVCVERKPKLRKVA